MWNVLATGKRMALIRGRGRGVVSHRTWKCRESRKKATGGVDRDR